jgi:5-formyltetrahydrofolate cyclo-ligase
LGSRRLLPANPLNPNTLSKSALRLSLRAKRKSLTQSERRIAEQRIVNHCVRLGCLKRQGRLGIYLAIGSEASLNQLIRMAVKYKMAIFIPRIKAATKTLQFVRLKIHHDPRSKVYDHGRKDHTRQWLPAHRLNTLLIPLLGFDDDGNRLGQGGGYYDKTLQNCHQFPSKVGIAFECQHLQFMPSQSHDVKMDVIISEKKVRWFKQTSQAISNLDHC